MKFGLFSNGRRPDKPFSAAWQEDIFEIGVADELGFDEAWISEHEIPAELIISKAAAVTTRIRLGPGVRGLPYYHPFQVALEANALDQLTGGRYQLGVGAGYGGNAGALEWRGGDQSKARDMTLISLDLIQRLWSSDEPIDFDGPFWSGRAMKLPLDPIQAPHVPVAVACSQTTATAELAGRSGFILLTSQVATPQRLHEFGEAFLAGAAAAGRPTTRDGIRTTRVVYVAPTDEEARRDLRDSYNETIAWDLKNRPRHQAQKLPPSGDVGDVTFDFLVDAGVLFVGSPRTVLERIRDFHDETGGFGTLLLHAGRDYATREKRERSLRLFAQDVVPALQALGPDRQHVH